MESIAINVAYALYVGSALAKTEIKLRVSLVIVSIAFIVWAIVAGQTSALIWNILFGGSHLYQLIRRWQQHRAIEIAAEAEVVHQRLFSDLSRLEFFGLWSVGMSRKASPGEPLIIEGTEQKTISIVLSGEVVVERATPDGPMEIARLGQDALLGERSFVTGQPASASVTATTETVVHEWSQEKLGALRELCPPAHGAVVRLIGVDLAAKLR